MCKKILRVYEKCYIIQFMIVRWKSNDQNTFNYAFKRDFFKQYYLIKVAVHKCIILLLTNLDAYLKYKKIKIRKPYFDPLTQGGGRGGIYSKYQYATHTWKFLTLKNSLLRMPLFFCLVLPPLKNNLNMDLKTAHWGLRKSYKISQHIQNLSKPIFLYPLPLLSGG